MYSHDRLVRKMELKRMKLEVEKKILREALSQIVHNTNHVAHDSEEASIMIYRSCEIAKHALEKTK